MSDEREAMAAAVQAVTAPQALRVPHKAIVKDQSGGSVGAELPGQGAPSATVKPAPVWFGLPGFSAVFAQNVETSIAFHEGKESGAFAMLFPYYQLPSPLPVTELAFGGGTKPIARVDDTVGAGALVFRQTPAGPGGVPSVLGIFYKNQQGVEIPVLAFPIPGPAIMIALDPEAPDPSTAIVPIGGIITSGRAEFKA